jgi:hypothetical protein
MEGKVAYIRFTVHTSQENCETVVTSEVLDEFREALLRKKIHNNDFDTEKAFHRNFRHLYFVCRRHIKLHMPIAIVLTSGTS